MPSLTTLSLSTLKPIALSSVIGASLLLGGCLAGDNDTTTGAATSSSAAPAASTSSAANTPAPTTSAPAPVTKTGGTAFDSASPFPARSGLLWKAVSHGFSGRLIVLIPKSWASFGSTVNVLDAGGNLIEKGDIYHPRDPNVNGGRRHFLFDRTGSSYGNNLVLSFEGRNYQIPFGGRRYD